MLLELEIRDFAVIDSLKVPFEAGLNVFTGETGAGKSIIVDALSLALGGKAGSACLRKNASVCRVSAVFDAGKNRPVQAFLKDLSLDSGEDVLILRREVDAQGRSRSFINDRPVSLAALADLGDLLVDIHGQHDHQKLLKSGEQRNLLDSYADAEALKEEVGALYSGWKDLAAELEASKLSEQERSRKIGILEFELKEIDSAKLVTGEDEELERALPQIKNADRLRVIYDEIYDRLYESDGSALENLRKSRKLSENASALGADLGEILSALEDASSKVSDVSERVGLLRDKLSSDPAQVDALIARQDLIFNLKRKYGSTIPEILAHGQQAAADLARFQNHSETLKALEEDIRSAESKLMKRSKDLTALRKKCAEKMQGAVQKELKDLGFEKACFQVSLIPETDAEGKTKPTPQGLEKAEFLFSANPGEDPKPLKAVASGGELSRVMLAVKKILSDVDPVPVLIFDEVDAGIGGSMGHVVGEKLRSISRKHQTLVITHLAQIAAFAHRHIAVRKLIRGNETRTFGEVMEKDTRVKEIARMMGGIAAHGNEPSPVSLKHASELLSAAK